jgi:hypothetical protein
LTQYGGIAIAFDGAASIECRGRLDLARSSNSAAKAQNPLRRFTHSSDKSQRIPKINFTFDLHVKLERPR